MLPEQVWDYADLPSEGMYFGKSAGSAQPLVWAHSEYLKLLRSVTDGHIFDRISVVEERYAVPAAKRTFTSQIEIFQTARPISSIPAGLTLRIVDHGRFRIVYTFDNWVTVNHLDSHSLGRIGYSADIPTTSKQAGKIIFTLCWPNQRQDPNQPDHWLGKNLEVSIIPPSSPLTNPEDVPGPARLATLLLNDQKSLHSRFAAPRRVSSYKKKEKNERPAAVRQATCVRSALHQRPPLPRRRRR